MNVRRERFATWSGLLGGLLGVVAGFLQIVAGTKLGAWSGLKADPVPLGALTVALSGVALIAALPRSWRPGSGHRAAVVAAELVPGLVCFTTVGRLWWLPGVLLLSAAAAEIGAAPAEVARVTRDAWPAILTSMLGVCLILVASTADQPVLWLGVGCGLTVAAAPWIAGRSVPIAVGALLLRAVLFASITWWTAVTPLVGVLALVTGGVAIRSLRRPGRLDC